jgi:superfamily II DNA or RNA helicase
MDFFELNSISPYDYQKTFLKEEFPKIYTKRKILFAAAPGAGKTVTSIACITDFLKENPKSRVLVLTHNQNVLKEQYYNELEKHKVSFTYSKDIDSNAQVVVTIPSSINNKTNLPEFKLIIIDEAHHFYQTKKEKGMVEKIIIKTKALYELLLTGTPSKFNNNKNKIHTFAVTINELYDRNQVSDVIIELATSNLNLSYKDYNINQELTQKAITKETESDVHKTLENVLDKLLIRLRSWHKDKPELYSKLSHNANWLPILGELKKTVIACKSITQANRVSEYLNNKGVNNLLSHSINDKDSLMIEKFRNNPKYLVLVVVDRGTLGFNMKELENIIDMTGSQNIDRILQLLCRVNRVHKDVKNKLFIKVTPINQVDYMHAIMCAVVAMFDKEWFLKYNGKNFGDIPIIIRKENNQKNTKPNIKSNNNNNKIKVIDFIGLPAISFFKTLNHKRDDVLSGVEYTTLSSVRNKFLDLDINPYKYWNLEKCKVEALKYNTKREWSIFSGSSYNSAKRNGWLESCCSHMEEKRKPNGHWTLENCKAEALKYKTRNEWCTKGSGSYTSAQKNGWIEECSLHMVEQQKPGGYWSLEICKAEALKYKSKTEWHKANPYSYGYARRNGWLESCCSHMKETKKPNGYWTLERCKEEAMKFKSTRQWQKNHAASYGAAYRAGWLDLCRSHMIK